MEEFVLINSTFNMSKLKTINYKEPGLAINIYMAKPGSLDLEVGERD
jgi:hypothetical protein